jgi:Trk K+ transport system NAD-binding subunit
MFMESFKEKGIHMKKMKYMFDNLMSKGTAILIGSLAIVTVLMITIVCLIVWASGANEGNGFLSLFWMGVMRSLDPGTMGGDTGGAVFVGAMFVITMGGIFIFSILVGLLTTGIESKLESLRKGHSKVIETGHTVILGWSNQIYTILTELITANSNRKRACIVIMSQMDKMEMDEEIRSRIPETKTTRIVTRNGSPIDLDDLNMVSLQSARSIIINDESDANVIKTILAIINSPNGRQEPYNIVAALKEPRNLEVARIAGRGQVELILEDQIISRIIAQTCRQSGLSAVYTELLDFDGDEIYLSSFDELAGKTYADALFMFKDSSVIGMKSGNAVRINPPMDTVLKKGDELIAVTADDDTLILSGSGAGAIDERAISGGAAAASRAEHTLILGWNSNAVRIIQELDNYAAPGSRVTVVSNSGDAETQIEGARGTMKNQDVKFVLDDITDRKTLDRLLTSELHHIVLLSDRSREDIQQADADTLITLLHLRNISENTGKSFTIVSEMLDIRNRTLAEVAKVNDFIVSDKLISLLISQISENNLLNAVFEDVFDADGSEIYIKPAGNYISTDTEVNFYTVVEAACRRGETAFGYIKTADAKQGKPGGGVYINPNKSDMIRFDKNDFIVVAAEN